MGMNDEQIREVEDDVIEFSEKENLIFSNHTVK